LFSKQINDDDEKANVLFMYLECVYDLNELTDVARPLLLS